MYTHYTFNKKNTIKRLKKTLKLLDVIVNISKLINIGIKNYTPIFFKLNTT